jgi:hypothetical protein
LLSDSEVDDFANAACRLISTELNVNEKVSELLDNRKKPNSFLLAEPLGLGTAWIT